MMSIKKNFIFNLVNTIAGLLFPLITFPYASRILLPKGIGLVNFYQSIIAYVILLSSIGIPLYSIREIARVRDNQKNISITAIEILLLHTFLTAIGYLVIFILCFTLSEIKENISLFLVLSSSIFFTALGCEWFYQGIEDFKYIVIRNLIVKCVFVIFLFLFVKTKDDLLIYGVLSILGSVGNNVFNFFRLRKFVNKKLFNITELHPFRHFRPALKVFILNLVISLYVNLNPVMLGFLADVTAVGFFTVASKISHMVLGISGALQNAVLPRTSNLLQTGEYEKFKILTQRVMDFIFLTTIPLSIGLVILSPYVVSLMSGDNYQPASLSLVFLSPIIFFIALSGLFGIQMLYPQGKENLVIIATSIGALVNFGLNFILIPLFSHVGASISTLSAEILATITMAYLGRKYLPIDKFNSHYLNCILGSGIMGGACVVISCCFDNEIIIVGLSLLIGVFVYFLWLYFRKDSMVLYLGEIVKNRF